MVRTYRYLHYDVFTNRQFGGNQLAVLPDASGLSGELMQAITREFNFSESTFILPAESRDTDIRMRIFTPGREMPMAGHPTVGSTFALCREGIIPPGKKRWTFGLTIGPTPVNIEWEGDSASFVWMNQPLPSFGPVLDDVGQAAAAIRIEEHLITATGLPVEQVSCGVPFVFIPVATRSAVDRAEPDAAAFTALCRAAGADDHAMFVFSTEQESQVRPFGDVASGLVAAATVDDLTVYSRMFAPGLGVLEDPATGSASGPLGSYLARHGVVKPEQARKIVNLQGVRMGRPSKIHVDIGMEQGAITHVRVGGQAVLVAEGELKVRM